ncbi:MAG TPA: transposase [Nostocaceae cyanobacterium]|nr:transposase [Nostocaceae cyanobacterium]
MIGWQARLKTGFDVSAFVIDWEQKVAICPQGNKSRFWRETHTRNRHANLIIEVVFDSKTCATCPVRADCTCSKTTARKLTLRPREEYEALQQRRDEQRTPEFQQKYSLRAWVEGTISQAVGKFQLRRTRYFGLAKTHLQNVATACGMNLTRLFAWWKHQTKAQTRISRFAKLFVEYA